MSAFDEWADNLNESTSKKQNFLTGYVRVWMRMAFNAGAEIERLRSIADNNAANGLAAEERVKELEAELEQCLDCCKYVGEVEAERDRLKAEMAYDAEHIKSLRTEVEAYKKGNAYFIEQLPIQKHQKFTEGLEAAAQECESVDEKTCANLIRALKDESCGKCKRMEES